MCLDSHLPLLQIGLSLDLRSPFQLKWVERTSGCWILGRSRAEEVGGTSYFEMRGNELQTSIKSTYDVHCLIVYPRLDVVLPLQEARQQLHPEATRKTICRDPSETGFLSLLLAHPLSCVLVLTYSPICLVSKQVLLVLVRILRRRLSLGCGRENDKFLGRLRGTLRLRCPSDWVRQSHTGR